MTGRASVNLDFVAENLQAIPDDEAPTSPMPVPRRPGAVGGRDEDGSLGESDGSSLGSSLGSSFDASSFGISADGSGAGFPLQDISMGPLSAFPKASNAGQQGQLLVVYLLELMCDLYTREPKRSKRLFTHIFSQLARIGVRSFSPVFHRVSSVVPTLCHGAEITPCPPLYDEIA